MAQKQNNAGNTDISSRSFDEILERMRNRVSEISKGGDVDKVLDHDSGAANSETGEGQVVLTEEEQDRAFLLMSQKQSNSHSEQAESGKDILDGNGVQDKSEISKDKYSLQERRADQTSELEMNEEDELEAQTYQKILSALEVKELSKLENDNPNELDEIVSEKTSAAVSLKQDGGMLPANVKRNKQPYDDDFKGNLQPVDVTHKQPEQEMVPEPKLEAKKSSQAFDRLAMVAGSLEKSLDEKVQKKTGVVVSDEPAAQSLAPVMVTSVPVAPEASARVADKKPVATIEVPQVPEVAMDSAPLDTPSQAVSVISKDDVSNKGQVDKGHEQRLDRIEDSLKLLMTAQVENEEKASGLLVQQQDSFRKMTSEAQKVAEATASKIAIQSSAHIVLDTIKEHAVSRSDMTVVQDELKLLNDRFGKSVEKQNEAYDLMQSSLATLHEKISEIGVEKQVASTAGILVDADLDKKAEMSPEEGGGSADKLSAGEAELSGKAQDAVLKEDEELVARQEELPVIQESISAQVLRDFVNAPMVNHDIQSLESEYTQHTDTKDDQEPLRGEVRAPSIEESRINPAMSGGYQAEPVSRANGHHTTEFSGHTHQQRFESLVQDKKKIVNDTRGKAKSSALLAISSMLMFSVSGYLFYDQLKTQETQGAPEMTASVSQPVSQNVAANSSVKGLVGEKKMVKWDYSGRGKVNTERLSENDKTIRPESKTQYMDVASNTEIIEVSGGGMNTAPIVTSSLGRHEALDLTTGAEKIKKLANGKFVRPSVTIGSSSLRQAAGKGVASAMFEVARRFQNGKGVKKSYKEAVKWYRRSADKGYAPAQYRLGTLFERGRGVPKQIEKARDWYRKAAHSGNVKAMHNLGVIFSGQKQIKADYTLATKWFGRAAKYGLADSQFNLAIINYNGLGKSKDVKEAYKWFALAAKNGDKAAKEQKDNLARKMKIKQIMDSRRMVSAWKTMKPSRKANINLSQKYYWRDYASM